MHVKREGTDLRLPWEIAAFALTNTAGRPMSQSGCVSGSLLSAAVLVGAHSQKKQPGQQLDSLWSAFRVGKLARSPSPQAYLGTRVPPLATGQSSCNRLCAVECGP
eukprot:4565704-Amphidinium_carterae.1